MMKVYYFTFTFMFLGCSASYYTDLISTFSLDPDNPPTGTSKVPGPEDGTWALEFTPDAPPIYQSGPTAANLITTLHRSSDLTFYTEFKMPRALQKDETWDLFSLQGGSQEVLFSIGLKKKSTSGGGAENTGGGQGNLKQIFYISQYLPFGKTGETKEHILIMKDEFKPGQWYKLSVRIRTGQKQLQDETANVRARKRREVEKVEAQIKVDCKEVGKIEMKSGRFADYVPFGYASFGCIVKKEGGRMVANRRFPGPMVKTQIINGPLAYNFYSPCDADFSRQEIPSEPLANQYSDKKLKEFLALSAAGSFEASLTCPGTNTTKYRGETWRHPTNRDITYVCTNEGKVIEVWGGSTCVDPKTGQEYRKKAKWIDSQDVCLENECNPGGFYGDIKPQNISCADPPLTKDDCGGLEPVKSANECCPKCGSETCSKDRQYYMGCDRKCSHGSIFACSSKTAGCWCPEGYAENEEGLCIKVGNCPCKSGDVVYQPGQTAVRSSCSTCVCSDAEMKCFSRCYV